MIRNQGALLVRGFRASDTMMQYMAKADSPTKGRDGTSHFGDIEKRNMVSPFPCLAISSPCSLAWRWARACRTQIATLTWIGDGGQSTGVTYEGINFAAVQQLGLVLFVESNLWAYSTPSEMQYRVKDLAERASDMVSRNHRRRHRRLPGLRRRSRRRRARPSGEGPTMIEAKMMRMKGHAIHDAAAYVPSRCLTSGRNATPSRALRII